MQPHRLFLINPRSGNRSGSQLVRQIGRYCTRRQSPFTIRLTPADGNYGAIAELIQAAGITQVVICGGDGTISAVVSALRHLPVCFGIIPRGSGNGLALAAGISRNPRKALDIVIRNKPGEVDAVQVNGYFSCMLTGLGFDAVVAHAFDRQQQRGFLKYAQLTLLHFFTMQPYNFVLDTGSSRFSVKAFFVCIATSNQFGNHFTIAPQAQLNDGRCDVVVVQPGSRGKFWWRVLGPLRYESSQGDRTGIAYFQSPRLRIENTDGAPLHIDGDGRPTAASLTVEVLPAAYRLLLP